MLSELIHDPIFLAGKSEAATLDDISTANDLLETLIAHKDACVGMAANMIGVRKRIIAFLDESGRTPTYTIMFNPKIIKHGGIYEAEEGCLSLLGGPRKCKRIRASRYSIKLPRCRHAPRHTLDGQLRSFSTRWTTVSEC